ncbi:hypothetical protein, partial [Leifsonia sp. NPDC058230]|uniref:hypothetical protein n=1 Tax=Leifsonia sp. NPDC058230 TaxID=3346391 RepID=UPI0036DBE94D
MKYGTFSRTWISQLSWWMRWWWRRHKQDPVVQVGAAVVVVPPPDVVRFGIGRRVGAAAPGAAAVAFGEGEFLGAGEEAVAAAEVEDFTVGAEDGGDEVGVGGHPPDR